MRSPAEVQQDQVATGLQAAKELLYKLVILVDEAEKAGKRVIGTKQVKRLVVAYGEDINK